jgi:hypothetical protein
MVIWNLLDGGLSHSRLLLRPSESMLRAGIPGTNPRHFLCTTAAFGHATPLSVGAGPVPFPRLTSVSADGTLIP